MSPPELEPRITISRDRDWIVVTLNRRRVRHIYLTPDDAELLVRLLQPELPELTTAQRA